MLGDQQPRARTLEVHRGDILTESALVVGIYSVLVLLISETAPLQLTSDPSMQFVFSVMLVLSVSIVLLGIGIFVAKWRSGRRHKIQQVLRVPIIDVVTRIARGEARGGELKDLYDRAPELTGDVFAESLTAQKGTGRKNLAQAAESLGIIAEWKRQTESSNPQTRCNAIIRLGLVSDRSEEATFRKGMEDSEELVALESARALIAFGHADILGGVLEGLPRQTRLMRALLCEWLKKHATTLSTSTIPVMLRSSEKENVVVALEVLANWRRALLLADLDPLLDSPDPDIRAAAWHVVPYALGQQISDERLNSSLRAEHAIVRAAAWNSISRMRLMTAANLVPLGIEDVEPQVSLAACYAAGALGMRQELERAAVSGKYPMVGCATEALEKFMIGRLER